MPELLPVGPVLAVAIYIVWWWMALFIVLPIGVRSLDEAGHAADGSERGAPEAPNLAKKALWATGLAAAFWAATMIVISLNLFSLTV